MQPINYWKVQVEDQDEFHVPDVGYYARETVAELTKVAKNEDGVNFAVEVTYVDVKAAVAKAKAEAEAAQELVNAAG